MATTQEMMTALRNADAAGDTEAATRIAAMIQGAGQQEAPIDEAPVEYSSGPSTRRPPPQDPSLMDRIGEGISDRIDTFQGAADIAGSALHGMGKGATEIASRVGGLALGHGVDRNLANSEAVASDIWGNYDLGQDGAAIIQQIADTYQMAPEELKSAVESAGGYKEHYADKAYEATGSPLVGAGVQAIASAPEVIMGAMGLKQGAQNVGKRIANRTQAPAKQEMAKRLAAGRTSDDLATVQLEPRPNTPELPAPIQAGPSLGAPQAAPKVSPPMQPEIPPRVINYPAGKRAVGVGVKPAVVSSIKQAEPRTKKKIKQMLNMIKHGRTEGDFRVQVNPNKVLGNTMLERFKHLDGVRKNAGKRIKRSVNDMKGKYLSQGDTQPIVDTLYGQLDELDIKYDLDTGKLNFNESILRKNPSAVTAIRDVFDVNRGLMNGKVPSSYDLHKAKKIIDDMVSFEAKQKSGLSQTAEESLKKIRASINDTLKANYKGYRDANATYSEVVDPINEIQRLAGNSFDLDGPGASGKLGQLSRRITSNAASREPLLQAFKKLDKLSKKHGAKFGDDLFTEISASNEFERLFGTSADTSIQGIGENVAGRALQTGTDVATGGKSTLLRQAGEKAAEIFSPSEEKQIEAILELLK